jgi:ABC-2 type transport system permease protein
MLSDDLRCIWAITVKDLRAYYFKPPNISWGILFPFAFALAFVLRNPTDLQGLLPGLLALTILFGTSSMEAIVITFERRIGALERLLLAPIRLPALLVGKMLGGVVFGLVTAVVVLVVALLLVGAGGIHWGLLLVSLVLSAVCFSALGVLVSVSVKEVFEAQTLANAFRFPMIFLGGVFVPIGTLPLGLRIVARCLPLTYAVESMRAAMEGGALSTAALGLGVLAVFTAAFFGLAWWIMSRRVLRD